MTVSAVDKLPLAPSAEPAPPLRLSFGEYLDWLDEDKHAEWVNGEVVMHSPVSARHTRIGRFLILTTQTWADAHDLGETFYEPFQMKTGPDLPCRAPDILFVARENLYRLGDNLLEGPADLVVEIISPESRTRDRVEKFREYQMGGVSECWLLDPQRKTADFYSLGPDGKYAPIPLDDAGRFHSAVLPGFWLKADWLWQEPLPNLNHVMKEWEL